MDSKSISLFLVDGTSQGILVVDIKNWSGKAISGPRRKIKELISRPEIEGNGIYFLTGADPNEVDKTLVYIGESKDLKKEIETHNKDKSKSFWDRAIAITSMDKNLTKVHARYLQGRMLNIIQDFGHVNIDNAKNDTQEELSEFDVAYMESFILQIRLILPILGSEFLQVRRSVSANPIFTVQRKTLNVKAQVIKGEFVVLKGSEAVAKWKNSDHHYKKLHASHVKSGKLVVRDDGQKAIFQEDTIFNSPSAASAVVLGHGGNPYLWVVKGNVAKTYVDWKEESKDTLGSEFLQVRRKVSASPIFTVRRKTLNVKAQVIKGEFVVLKGSEAEAKWRSTDHHYKKHHEALVDSGRLVVSAEGQKAIFQEDTIFKSPSAASAIVLGRAGSPGAWVVKGNVAKTYVDWKEENKDAQSSAS